MGPSGTSVTINLHVPVLCGVESILEQALAGAPGMITQIAALLVTSPDVCGGRLRIEGTRITANQIVVWYKKGSSPEEIAEMYPNLTLAQVYTALAYYHANKEAVETELAAEIEEATRLEREFGKS
jgi:uncharacterized protein (DUF433 family)